MSSQASRVRMADWVEEYLDVGIQSEVDSTRRAPRQVLRPFAKWYDQTRRHPRNVSRDDVVRFFLREAPFAGKIEPSTHNTYRIHLRNFLHWAMEAELLKTNMALLGAIKRREARRRNFVRMSDVELAEMIDGCDNLRDRALLAANVHATARSSELKALRLGDIHLDQHVIDWYNVKKGRPIQKRIPPQLDRALRLWITAYRGGAVQLEGADGVPWKEWLAFPRRSGSHRAIYYPTLPIADTVKLVQRYTEPFVGRVKYDGATHMNRRSGAKALKLNLVERGMDPGTARAIAQAMLDHEDPKTTDLYTGDSLNQMLAHQALGEDFLPDLNNVTKLRSVDDGKAASM